MFGSGAHPLYGAWAGDPEVEAQLGGEADLRAMVRFEVALAQAQADHGVIPMESSNAIVAAVAGFAPDMERLKRDTAMDGVAAPGLVRQLRETLPPEYRAHLHFGATSQDAVDTSLMVRLATIAPLLEARLSALIQRLDALEARFGDRTLMAVTRGQDALPIAVRDRLQSWRRPLAAQRAALGPLQAALAVQLAGPVGTLSALGAQGAAVRATLAQRLGLADPGGPWHSDRQRIGAVAAWHVATGAALGKIGADLLLMAQTRVGAAVLAGGASSSMAHKINPVDAELLVALARHAAVLAAGVSLAATHESERSGVAWTLEWLTLPPLVATVGAATRAAARLLDAVRALG